MVKQKVPQGYSPDESAGSLTPFGMTFNREDIL